MTIYIACKRNISLNECNKMRKRKRIPMTTTLDPSICTLCGEDNACAYIQGLPIDQCWCRHNPIPKGLLERIPAEKRNQACVCIRCVNEFFNETGGAL